MKSVLLLVCGGVPTVVVDNSGDAGVDCGGSVSLTGVVACRGGAGGLSFAQLSADEEAFNALATKLAQEERSRRSKTRKAVRSAGRRRADGGLSGIVTPGVSERYDTALVQGTSSARRARRVAEKRGATEACFPNSRHVLGRRT